MDGDFKKLLDFLIRDMNNSILMPSVHCIQYVTVQLLYIQDKIEEKMFTIYSEKLSSLYEKNAEKRKEIEEHFAKLKGNVDEIYFHEASPDAFEIMRRLKLPWQ